MTRRADLVTFEVLVYSWTPDPRFISLHLPLLYAVSPGLQQNMFVDNYQQYNVSFDAFRIHRGGILPFPICALGSYIFLVPLLLCLVRSIVPKETRKRDSNV